MAPYRKLPGVPPECPMGAYARGSALTRGIASLEAESKSPFPPSRGRGCDAFRYRNTASDFWKLLGSRRTLARNMCPLLSCSIVKWKKRYFVCFCHISFYIALLLLFLSPRDKFDKLHSLIWKLRVWSFRGPPAGSMRVSPTALSSDVKRSLLIGKGAETLFCWHSGESAAHW